jgi:hypothetical protein
VTCKLLPSNKFDQTSRRGQQNIEWCEVNRTRQLCGDCERLVLAENHHKTTPSGTNTLQKQG